MTTIGEICNRDVIYTTPEASVCAVAKLMRQHHVGSIVVVADAEAETKVPVGIVTDRDIVVEVTAMELDPAVLTVGDIMSGELITAREHQGLLETMEIMRQKGVRRLPIVDDAETLVGLVAIDDLIEIIADELSELTKVIVRQQAHEAVVRK